MRDMRFVRREQLITMTDTCHEKIDLFGGQNIVILELSWWKYYSPSAFNAVDLIEPSSHKFEYLKTANFLNPEEVYFLVTRVNCDKLHCQDVEADCLDVLIIFSMGI